MKRDNQHLRILKVLWAGRSLTKMDCFRPPINCTKGDTRIAELVKLGYDIQGQWEHKNGTRYKRYFIPDFYSGKLL